MANPWVERRLDEEDGKGAAIYLRAKKANKGNPKRGKKKRVSKEARKREKRKKRIEERNRAFLALHNYASYDEYLRSKDWKLVKQAYYRDRSRLQECLCCGSKWFQLHHKDYIRCGRDALNHLIPLCGTCHRGVHDVLDDNGWPVTETKSAIAVYSQWLSEGELERNWQRLRTGRGRRRRKKTPTSSRVRTGEQRHGKSLRKYSVLSDCQGSRTGDLSSRSKPIHSLSSLDSELESHLSSIRSENQ